MISAVTAQWACDLTFKRMPERVVESVKLQLLDTIGVMLAARENDIVASVHSSVLAESGPADTYAIGFPDGLSASSAALLNGTSGLVMEFDNSHIKTGSHVTSSVVAATLPAACKLGLPGETLIEAMAAGTELACRLGLIAPGMLHRNGFHPTAIFGIFGATYAVAKCRGFDAQMTKNAVGISGSLSAGSMASWEDGTAAKSLHAGLAASSAVHSVSLAAHGLTGPGVLFDGRFGFFKAHVQDQGYEFNFDAFHRNLGDIWELTDIAPKAYPCGHYIQPSIDAVLALANEHEFSANEVEEVTCSLADYTIPLVALPVAEKIRPVSPFQARFSLQHSVAEAVVLGKLDRHSYSPESLANPAINSLAARVKVQQDPMFSDRSRLSGKASVTLQGGRRLRHRVENMRGMPQNPMSADDLVAKFKSNITGVLNSEKGDEVIDAVFSLEKCEDVRPLIELLSTRA